jgi:hypothetical protein
MRAAERMKQQQQQDKQKQAKEDLKATAIKGMGLLWQEWPSLEDMVPTKPCCPVLSDTIPMMPEHQCIRFKKPSSVPRALQDI